MRIYLHKVDDGAQSHYRSVLPAKFCPGYGVEMTTDRSRTRIDHIDAFMLPRLLSPALVGIVEKIKSHGKKFVWELDDDLWNLNLENPASRVYTPQALEVVLWAAQQADAIVVSTEPLKVVVKEQTGKDAVVLNNLVDLDDWPQLPPQDDGPIRILWCGSQHHAIDLPQIVEPLNRLLAEYEDQIQVLFFGDYPDDFAELLPIKYSHLHLNVPHSRYQGRVGFVSPVPLSDYARTLCVLRADVALAPLAPIKFNHSKSNCKYMEYSMAGAATVATDMPPYQCINDGVDGLLVPPGDTDSWYRSVKRLIEDAADRRRLAANARKKVGTLFSWQHSRSANAWRRFFREEIWQ